MLIIAGEFKMYAIWPFRTHIQPTEYATAKGGETIFETKIILFYKLLTGYLKECEEKSFNFQFCF